MGAKKKPEAASKKEGGDDSTERLYRAYRRNLNEYGVTMPRKLEEKFSEIRDEKNPGKLEELLVWEETGPSGMRAIMDALREIDYQHLKSIRCWKANTEDEGLRAIVQYMMTAPQITHLELFKCNVSPLGCEFLGTYLTPGVPSALITLKLDHNPISDTGISNIATGLRMNTILSELSLAFCGITENGGRALMEILINQNSGIEYLNLQGNLLKNNGICSVLHALQVNHSIKNLDVGDNQFNDSAEVIQKLFDMLSNNTTLQVLDARYNGFYDEGVMAICDMFRNGPNGPLGCALTELIISQSKVTPEIFNELEKAIAGSRRGRKGKKGGKKKKK